MKRKLWILPALAILLVLLGCGAALAETSGSCGDHVTYTVNDLGEMKISGTGPMWDFDQFDPGWFETRENILYVTIEEGVTSVGNYAFYLCYNMRKVSMYDSVTRIGNDAFYYCESLETANLSANLVSIGDEAFYGTAVTKVEPSNGLTGIGDYAFCDSGLKSVILPSSVTSIGDGAFASCLGLTDATVYNPAAVFGSQAFHASSASLTLHAFAGSTADAFARANGIAFSALAVSGKYGDHVTWKLDPATGLLTVSGTGPIWEYNDSPIKGYEKVVTAVEIGEGITSVGYWAFSYYTALTSLKLPSTLTTLEGWAFYYCPGITSLTIPASLTHFGNDAFAGWDGLTDLTIENGVTEIGASAFEYCDALTTVSIPPSVTAIGTYAFSKCYALTSVSIGSGVKTIDEFAFYNCTGLTSVSIPAGVETINRGAFWSCPNLTSVTVHSRSAEFGEHVFHDCPRELVIRCNPFSTAEDYAKEYGFAYAYIQWEMQEPDFVLPLQLKAVGEEAFRGNKARFIYIPNTVTSLSSKAFADCTLLLQIRIPPTVTVIPSDLLLNVPTANLTIFGAPGSAAESFASAQGIRFEIE